jgi:MBOAT, membrane-bound O-acyltransferase family
MTAIRKPLDYALYLAFFPQLLAGPIVRSRLFFGELFAWRPPGPDDVTYGFARVGFGLVKKMAIADQFAPIANGYFGSITSHPGAPAAWGAVFAFGMQIYFDFSGYSDIAIGCARLLGFVFPENFRMPYLATSITDFWHRWHITLSTWLRDYLYIPLGGSRHGTLATLRNLMITMLLGGLWHGAQWTFVAWGGVHGVMLCIERLLGIGHERDAARFGSACAHRSNVYDRLASLGAFPRADLWGCDWRLSRARRRRRGAAAADRLARGFSRRHHCLRLAALAARSLEDRAVLDAASSTGSSRSLGRAAPRPRDALVAGHFLKLHLL